LSIKRNCKDYHYLTMHTEVQKLHSKNQPLILLQLAIDKNEQIGKIWLLLKDVHGFIGTKNTPMLEFDVTLEFHAIPFTPFSLFESHAPQW